jgi:hypothetical protein
MSYIFLEEQICLPPCNADVTCWYDEILYNYYYIYNNNTSSSHNKNYYINDDEGTPIFNILRR